MSKYNLLCMSFDGDFVIETNRGEPFDSISEAWAHSNDMGSRWYFYPFHFVVTESRLTIADVPEPSWLFDWITNKRVKTISAIFKTVSDKSETQGLDYTTFPLALLDHIGDNNDR